MGTMNSNKAKYEPIARQAAQKYGIDPNLFVAQIQQESGWNPNAKSGVGAAGIGQIMPGTAKSWGVKNVYDPVESLNAAAKNMAGYVKTYMGNKKLNPNGDYLQAHKLALAAYNAGPGNVSKHGGIPPFAETKNYVKNISKAYSGNDPNNTNKSNLAQYSKETLPNNTLNQYIKPNKETKDKTTQSSQSIYQPLASNKSNLNAYSGLSATSPTIYQTNATNKSNLALQQLAVSKAATESANQLKMRNQQLDEDYSQKQAKYKQQQLAFSTPIYQTQDVPRIPPPTYQTGLSDMNDSVATNTNKKLQEIQSQQDVIPSNYGLKFDGFTRYLNQA